MRHIVSLQDSLASRVTSVIAILLARNNLSGERNSALIETPNCSRSVFPLELFSLASVPFRCSCSKNNSISRDSKIINSGCLGGNVKYYQFMSSTFKSENYIDRPRLKVFVSF